ncbi:MAG: LacI family DNA-binding transcriptional regulator [Planctomycetota bacterium]
MNSVQPTVRDVARAAEVSVGTVSRVLRGEPNVAQDTAQRVQDAVQRLNYAPLRRRATLDRERPLLRKSIALVLLGMDRSLETLPSVASGIHGTESALASAGAEVLLADLPLADHVPQPLSRRQAHGVLAKGALQTMFLDQVDPELVASLRKTPTVWFLGRPQGADWGDVVQSDDAAAGRLAAEYLLARGHRRMAILDPKPSHVTLSQRCASFAWHATNGGAHVEHLCGKRVNASKPTLPLKSVDDPESIERLVVRLLKLRRKPTAIFVPADCIAAMAYRAFAGRGLTIGKDFSLISCNNELSLLAGLYPEVTTIDIRAQQIGRQAVDQLIWRLGHPNSPNVSVSVEPRLVEGMSVADISG